MLPNIRAPILMLALLMVAGCSGATLDAATAPSPTMPRPTAGSVPGHVYLVRGLVGEVFSLGFYDLAGRVKERGINASVHSMYAPGLLANEIIAVYRRAPAPIVLIGHSSGADAVIGVAEKLKSANVPVILMFGFDPTPIAGLVPENVELFINLYQKTNLIGGGEVKAARDFRGRIVNVDLRERREIIHITLDKSVALHLLVADKIAAVLRAAVQPANPARRRKEKAGATPYAYVTPLAARYVVPADVPIVLWDSAVRGMVGAGEGLEDFAVRMGAPPWAIASINNVSREDPLTTGTSLLVPRSSYNDGR